MIDTHEITVEEEFLLGLEKEIRTGCEVKTNKTEEIRRRKVSNIDLVSKSTRHASLSNMSHDVEIKFNFNP